MSAFRALCRSVLLVWLAVTLSACGYNQIQSADEAVTAAWSEVLNQYQRRADLIPNLVSTVEGFARQEREVLMGVTDARSRVGQVRVDPSDPAAVARFEQAQREVGSALSRLLAVAENYPQLKSDQNFRDLQAQLEGTENRIAVARRRHIQSIEQYNVLVRRFPVNLTAWVFGYERKPAFAVENERELAKPPAVQFGAPAAPRP